MSSKLVKSTAATPVMLRSWHTHIASYIIALNCTDCNFFWLQNNRNNWQTTSPARNCNKKPLKSIESDWAQFQCNKEQRSERITLDLCLFDQQWSCHGLGHRQWWTASWAMTSSIIHESEHFVPPHRDRMVSQSTTTQHSRGQEEEKSFTVARGCQKCANTRESKASLLTAASVILQFL